MKRNPAGTAEAPDEEIAALVQTLHRTQQRLQELTGGEVDAVVQPGGQSYLLQKAQEKLQHSEEKHRELASVRSSTPCRRTSRCSTGTGSSSR